MREARSGGIPTLAASQAIPNPLTRLHKLLQLLSRKGILSIGEKGREVCLYISLKMHFSDIYRNCLDMYNLKIS